MAQIRNSYKEQIREEMDDTDCAMLENQNDLEQVAVKQRTKKLLLRPLYLNIDSITDGAMEGEQEENLDSEEDSIENSPAPSLVSECLKMMDSVSKRFILSSGDVPICVTDVKQALMCLPKSQSRITDFLCPKITHKGISVDIVCKFGSMNISGFF